MREQITFLGGKKKRKIFPKKDILDLYRRWKCGKCQYGDVWNILCVFTPYILFENVEFCCSVKRSDWCSVEKLSSVSQKVRHLWESDNFVESTRVNRSVTASSYRLVYACMHFRFSFAIYCFCFFFSNFVRFYVDWLSLELVFCRFIGVVWSIIVCGLKFWTWNC